MTEAKAQRSVYLVITSEMLKTERKEKDESLSVMNFIKPIWLSMGPIWKCPASLLRKNTRRTYILCLDVFSAIT